jgi:colanic acid biosynthesis protein WcaH
MASRTSHAHIPDALYREIIRHVPTVCVDFIVTYQGKFLLTRRARNPLKGKWWVLGGRILKGETFEEAVRRKLKEEANITRVRSITFLGVENTRFSKGVYGFPVQTINVVFHVQALEENVGSAGGDGALRWFSSIHSKWPSYVRRYASQVGFR